MEYVIFSRESLKWLQTYYQEQMETAIWTWRSDPNMTEFEDIVK
jgi:hypothetical protein